MCTLWNTHLHATPTTDISSNTANKEQQTFCNDLAQKMPHLSPSVCTQAPLVASGAHSVQQRPILFLDVTPPLSTHTPTQKSASSKINASAVRHALLPFLGITAKGQLLTTKPHFSTLHSHTLYQAHSTHTTDWHGVKDETIVKILVIGATHGDELTSVALPLYWVQFAQNHNPPNLHWRFIPALNPDGLFAKKSTRTNANGVDLNRNFKTPNWQAETEDYWVRRTGRDPRRYPGKHPLSEPESQFLEQQIENFNPQLIVSVHAPYGVLDYDGPQKPPNKIGSLYLKQVGIYPGSLGNYAGVRKKIPVVTLELKNAIELPSHLEMHNMWHDLLVWMRKKKLR